LFEDILAKMETVERFLYDLLHEDSVELTSAVVKQIDNNKYNLHHGTCLNLWNHNVTKSSLFEYFEIWERNILSKNVYFPKHDITKQNSLTRAIKNIIPFKEVKIGTERGFALPSKELARKMFEASVKSKVIWNDDDSDNMIDEEHEKIEREMNDIINKDIEMRKAEARRKDREMIDETNNTTDILDI